MTIAQQVYDDLIRRIKERMKSEIVVLFDYATGLQQRFLHGKLISRRYVRTHRLDGKLLINLDKNRVISANPPKDPAG
jgi:hypothetical protein